VEDPVATTTAGVSAGDSVLSRRAARAATDPRDIAVAVSDESAPAAEPVVVDPPPAPALSRRARRAWAASLVVTVVVTAGLTVWLFPSGVRYPSHVDARLSVQPGGGDPELVRQLQRFGSRTGGADAERVFALLAPAAHYATGRFFVALATRFKEHRYNRKPSAESGFVVDRR
jgi:hypothetical protein